MKRRLLDTHAFLCWLSSDDTLGSQSQKLIADTVNDVIISAATVWEIEIKRQLASSPHRKILNLSSSSVGSYHYRSLYFTHNRQGDCLYIIEIRLS